LKNRMRQLRTCGSVGALGGQPPRATRQMSTREVTVRIAPVAGKPGAYVARYRAEVLGATYSVEFEDSVMGGIALHGFAEMLRLKWGLTCVELAMEDQTLRFRSRAVVDALLTAGVETTRPVLCAAG